MKKLTSICLALILIMSLAACGGTAPLGKFLSEAEGDWYLHGDSREEMLRISADGSYEKYAALEDDEEFGTQNLIESGTIFYDKDSKAIKFEFPDGEGSMLFTGEMSDGILKTYDGNYYPSNVSGSLQEKFDGHFYANGDTAEDYYWLEDGEWLFNHDDEDTGISDQSHQGDLEYNGDRQELYMVEDTMDEDAFATMDIVSETELKDKDSGVSYLLVDSGIADDDEYYGDDEGSSGEPWDLIQLDEHYYLDGDNESVSLYFYADGTVHISAPGEGELDGTYSVDGDIVTIAADGTDDVLPLTIEDDGSTLVDMDGGRYLLWEE